MRIISRRAMALAVSLVCVFQLAGCGGGGDSDVREIVLTTESPETTATTAVSTTTTTIDPAEELLRVAEWVEAVGAYADAVGEQPADGDRQSSPALMGPVEKTSPSSPDPAASVQSGVTFTEAMPPELIPFFTCVAEHESGGNYGAVSGSGKYRGRYQMDRSFWLTHAPTEWVIYPYGPDAPVPVTKEHYANPPAWETASPWAQDMAAVNGYWNQGPGAWSGPNGAICVRYRV